MYVFVWERWMERDTEKEQEIVERDGFKRTELLYKNIENIETEQKQVFEE